MNLALGLYNKPNKEAIAPIDCSTTQTYGPTEITQDCVPWIAPPTLTFIKKIFVDNVKMILTMNNKNVKKYVDFCDFPIKYVNNAIITGVKKLQWYQSTNSLICRWFN